MKSRDLNENMENKRNDLSESSGAGNEQKALNEKAHKEADKAISSDPDFSNDATDDLDEGESARLGDEGAGMI